MAPTIRIDQEVYAWLQKQAKAFEDTPNTVLRRIAELNGEATEVTGVSKKRKYLRAKGDVKGAKTPQGEYRKPVLRALKKLGGKGSRSQVLREVEKAMADRFTQADMEKISSGDLRWQKTAEWEVAAMRDEGILVPSKLGRGVWTLSDTGIIAARSG